MLAKAIESQVKFTVFHASEPCIGRHSHFHPQPAARAQSKKTLRKRLTEAQVYWCHALKGILTQKKIGQLFGVSTSTVGDIHAGLQYAEIHKAFYG